MTFSLLKAVGSDLLVDRNNPTTEQRNNSTLLKAAVKWILQAQWSSNSDGLSAYYSLLSGWAGAYPEVTGYTIPTLFDY